MTVIHEYATTDTNLLNMIAPYEEPDDPNHRAHVVNPCFPPENELRWGPNMSAQQIVDIARVTGTEVIALCGHTFVPKYNPDPLDACEACIKIAGLLMNSMGE